MILFPHSIGYYCFLPFENFIQNVENGHASMAKDQNGMVRRTKR